MPRHDGMRDRACCALRGRLAEGDVVGWLTLRKEGGGAVGGAIGVAVTIDIAVCGRGGALEGLDVWGQSSLS